MEACGGFHGMESTCEESHERYEVRGEPEREREVQGERELGGEGSPAGDACRRREKGIREDPDVGFEGGGGGSEEEKAVASVCWRIGSAWTLSK